MTDQAPAVTAEDLDRMRKLTEQIATYQKSLAPRYEEISAELSGLKCADSIIQIMNFEGKNQFKTNIKLGDFPMEVTFKVKKV